MKILFLSSGNKVPSSRFRILPYLQHFRADGHSSVLANSFPQKYDYFPWMGFRPSQLLKRSVRWWHWLRAKLSKFDMVFIDIDHHLATDVSEPLLHLQRIAVEDFAVNKYDVKLRQFSSQPVPPSDAAF